ncbi:MAG: MATE family efflux transporter [Sphingomonadaceae bacterium]
MTKPVELPASRQSYRELLRLAGPSVLSRLGIMMMGLTDAIIVGRYSAVELGYHSLGWAPTMTVLVAALGLLFGVQVLTARHIGAGEPERTGAVLRRGISYALWLGLGSSLVLVFAGPPVMDRIGLEPELAAGASRALVIFSLSLTPYLVADCLWLWLEAQGKPAVPTAAMWIANGVNLALALWLVPGTSPFPVEGAVAAAWVTLVARTSLLLMLALYVWRWPRAHELGVFRKAPHDPRAAREQRRIGYASGLSFAIEAGSFAGLNFVAASLGTLVVAGWAVVMNISSIMFMVPLGIGTATGVLVSRAVGAKDVAAVRGAWAMGMKLTLLVLFLLSLLVFATPEMLAAAYTQEAEVVAMASAALVLSCLFYMLDGAQVVTANALRARGDIWFPTGMHCFSYVLVMLPLGWLFAVTLQRGLNGIVEAVIVASLISASGLITRFRLLRGRLRV